MKKTLVLGASTNPARYSNIATKRLVNYGHEVVLLGNKKGTVEGNEIQIGQPSIEDIDTITLYLGPPRQEQYYDFILNLKPKRIIFNPGTENIHLINLAKENDIEPVIACTLVMLSTNQY